METRFQIAEVTGEELRGFLGAQNLTQQTLATLLGMGKSNVSRWATGKFHPAGAFHLAVRHLMKCAEQSGAIQPTSLPNVGRGRPLVNGDGFDFSRAKCPHPLCQRNTRLMYGDRRHLRVHWALGKVVPVACYGGEAPATKHARVTRALDLRGRLWDISDWPRRRSLVPFEEERVKRVRARIGVAAMKTMPEHEARALFIAALQSCRDTLDKIPRPGCGHYLQSGGPNSSKSASRKKLYRMVCPNEQCAIGDGRLFSSNGTEIPPNPVGKGHLGKRRSLVRVPPLARRCPVCGDELRFPREVSERGGHRFSPPLVGLTCMNQRKVNHSPELRKSLGLPGGSRRGHTFYYDRKRGWTDVYLKALKAGSPEKYCRLHRTRMRVFRYYASRLNRVPKNIYKKFGPGLPIYRAVCPHGDAGVWLPADWKDRPGVERRFYPKRRKAARKENVRGGLQ